jgi:hypothetical protein
MDVMGGIALRGARTLLAALIVVLGIATCAVAPVRAQSSSSSSSSSSKQVRKPASAAGAGLGSGVVSAGAYRNSTLGFTCRIPAEWVLRTEEMNARDDQSRGADSEKAAPDSGRAGRVLLAAFSRPPEVRAEDVNGSIVIAAETVAAYPGLKDAAQYFGPLTEVVKAGGFEVVEEPYEFVIGTKTVARGDFQKDVGSRRMLQSTLVVLARGYAISFTFIGGTEDEVEELVQGLNFGAGAKAGK